MEITPENLRKIAKGSHYPASVANRALKGAADDLEAAMNAIQEKDRLFDNLVITIAAIVVASGGRVWVPKSVLEDIQEYELEKAPGVDDGIIYEARKKGGA